LRDAIERHDRVAASFSGGKDSLAVIYMLREAGLLDRVTVYHNDTGDLLPEVREVVEHVKGFVPHFVHIRGDVLAWQAEHGLPSDLTTFGADDVGRAVGQAPRLVSRYACCYANLMLPLWQRIKADGATLVIRGTRRGDFPRLPVESGAVADGVEFLHPIEDWSPEQVFDYLRSVGAPICRVYDEAHQSPECARCTAWMNVGTGRYLRQHHPVLFEDYRLRVLAVMGELDAPLKALAAELKEVAV
jgi:3'-phosphoadenosine 5'-phosphosulfate sulfotransferase (PAPS reductase)/FAD synthetase